MNDVNVVFDQTFGNTRMVIYVVEHEIFTEVYYTKLINKKEEKDASKHGAGS